jgi:hypothetical protein
MAVASGRPPARIGFFSRRCGDDGEIAYSPWRCCRSRLCLDRLRRRDGKGVYARGTNAEPTVVASEIEYQHDTPLQCAFDTAAGGQSMSLECTVSP